MKTNRFQTWIGRALVASTLSLLGTHVVSAEEPSPQGADIKILTVSPKPSPKASQSAPKRSASDRTTPSDPIHISSRSTTPQLEWAHQALQRGDMAAARAGYSAILAKDAGNLHALTALALIEAQEENKDAALALLQRAQALAPRDGTVLAVVAMIRPDPGTAQMESRLQNALAEQPEATGLYFVLGNLYAAQRRWGDAQNAYFHAVTSDAGNPDYLYNLAVSLEHLNQGRLAMDYYKRALTAARTRPTSFDTAQVDQRLVRLQALISGAP